MLLPILSILLVIILLVIIPLGFVWAAVINLDNASTFQTPFYDHINNPAELADEDSPKMSPCDYYISLRHKSWNELSEYEKGRMVLAAHIILDKCGTLSTLSELEKFLQTHLPDIPKPYPGGYSVLGGFSEWENGSM